jgi:hypothetical protein
VPPLASLGGVTTTEFEPTASYYAEQQQQHQQQQQLRSRPDCRESVYPTIDPPVPRWEFFIYVTYKKAFHDLGILGSVIEQEKISVRWKLDGRIFYFYF